MTIEELFGTLQQSVIGSWRKHLRTAKYGKHKALDEFYSEMPEKVDDLIEAWMGANGKKIGNFENLLKSANYNTLSYLKELKRICKEGYTLMDENEELKSILDDIVNLINSTLYKVKELSENNNIIELKDFILEKLNNSTNINESKPADVLSDDYEENYDLINISSCWTWMEDLEWKKMPDKKYREYVLNTSGLDVDTVELIYMPIMIAMQKLGREKTYDHIKSIVENPSEMEDHNIKL